MIDRKDLTRILTDKAPAPAGHYAQATVYDGLVYVSGQLPVSPDGVHDPEASFEDQARRAIMNLLAIVKEAGSSPERILRVTAYIAGIELWPAFNTVFADMLGQARPARTVVPVPALHFGYLIELDAIAAVEPS
ncbi:RidA family protein [Agrobacterium rhizogenes]|nr:RidA family protein [Rhizobium rhizogenes]NTH62060.1 RidA family protein [Rhizobium rhizogenes]NTH93686.1 RidA family protein [Rhizobium rhizogenes]